MLLHVFFLWGVYTHMWNSRISHIHLICRWKRWSFQQKPEIELLFLYYIIPFDRYSLTYPPLIIISWKRWNDTPPPLVEIMKLPNRPLFINSGLPTWNNCELYYRWMVSIVLRGDSNPYFIENYLGNSNTPHLCVYI